MSNSVPTVVGTPVVGTPVPMGLPVDSAAAPPPPRPGVPIDTTGDGVADSLGYDTSGDDHLDARELTHFLKTIDPRATTDELASLINQLFTIDKDNDGKISRAELLVSVGYWKELVAAQRAAAARKHMCACCRGSEPVMPEVAVAGTPILVLPADAVVVVVAQPLEMKR